MVNKVGSSLKRLATSCFPLLRNQD
uniref:Uncharacterized protein n=1 Tax=Rhizophora mucronata TaxID=61149 RepID=A0A2P2NVC6_RHIMU